MTKGHISAPSGLLRQERKEDAGDAEQIVQDEDLDGGRDVGQLGNVPTLLEEAASGDC